MKPYRAKRFFLSSLNTYLGTTLVETLRNDHVQPDNPHLIIGSLAPEQSKYGVPAGVRKVVDTSKLSFLSKVLLDSDVIVYDLFTCDLNEAEFAIKTLKMGELKEEKILIFVSSVMVWSDTPAKEKREGDEEVVELEGDPSSEPEPDPVDQAEDAPPKKEYVSFTETDYTRRRALPQYEAQKALETMCLSAGNSKPNLKSFVLCAGVLYGMGEQVLYEHFKTAWLQDPPYLEYFAEGRNRIPCIHVKDLALFVAKVAERPPTLNYIFAIDHNANAQQKRIVRAISKGVGTGEIKSVPRTNTEERYEDVFTIDLRMRPTKAFDAFIEEAANQEDPADDAEVKPEKYTFDWWCKEGIQKNIDKINKEFNKLIKLEAVRIFITGPPAVGKSFYAAQIAKYYNLPHVLIKDVVEQFKSQQTEEGEALRTALEEQRATMLEEAQAQYDLEKKKRKALGLPLEPFDESKVQPRLNEQQLYQAFKWRLAANDCQNRGYVLDGYPKTYVDVKGVFLRPDKPAEDGDENVPLVLDTTIAPQSVINFIASDEFLFERTSKLPESVIAGTHYTPQHMKRRLDNYRAINRTGTGFPIMTNFFQEHRIQLLNVDIQNPQNNVFEQSRTFIERDGRFNNYRDQEVDIELQRLKQEKLAKCKTHQHEVQFEQQTKRDAKESQLWQLQEEEYKIKQEHSRNYEREVLDSRSQPLRQYLNDNVVPFITEGLVELIKQSPEDPIDFLAEYLFKRSLQVQFPDPGKYFEGLNEQ